jgi:hypothetical protein
VVVLKLTESSNTADSVIGSVIDVRQEALLSPFNRTQRQLAVDAPVRGLIDDLTSSYLPAIY